MNVLIVDDEKLVIEDLESLIDWKEFGIAQVFRAYNAEQAKEIFLTFPVDLLLCDIEMPRTSGLELLCWVKNQYPKTEAVIVTCHVSFEYAQKALRLGSRDYLLKPVMEEDLKKVIGESVERIRMNAMVEEKCLLGNLWAEHQPLLREKFWMDVLSQLLPSDPETLEREAQERKISYKDSCLVLPALFRIIRDAEPPVSLLRAKKTEMQSCFAQRDADAIFLLYTPDCILGLFFFHEPAGIWSSGYLRGMIRELPSIQEMCCYIGEPLQGSRCATQVKRLKELDQNNVAQLNDIFLLREFSQSQRQSCLPDTGEWAGLLRAGREEVVFGFIREWFQNKKATDSLNQNDLVLIQNDLEQVLYSVLQENGIRAHELFNDQALLSRWERAAVSVHDMLAWTEGILKKAAGYLREVQQPHSVTDKVKKYIKDNLDTDLSRETVARQVFLNPDYLDRLFKRETGLSVNKYVMQKRVDLARKLLNETELSIGEIASRVGYANLSNFSAMFKRSTGENPVQYRWRNN